MKKNDTKTNKQPDWYKRWLVGDADAVIQVEALHLPKEVHCSHADLVGLGPFTEQAKHLLENLESKFGEHLPYVFGIAIRIDFYTSCRTGSPETHQFSDKYLPFDEDNASKTFRLGTPISQPISGEFLLIALAILSFCKAAQFQRDGDSTGTFDELYQATYLIAIASAHDNGGVILDRETAIKSRGGSTSAKLLHEPENKLKDWALDAIPVSRGSSKAVAREFYWKMPSDLKELIWDPSSGIENQSHLIVDPQRVIYDAIRARANPKLKEAK